MITMSRKPLSLLVLMLMIGGCSTVQKETPTRIDLQLSASERLNPDLHGRPSPIVLRLYELRNPVAFEHSDFFQLYQQPLETLALDLIAQEELELRPGEATELNLTTTADGSYLAVMAAYRNLTEANWRTVVALRIGELNQLQLRLDDLGIRHDYLIDTRGY